MKPWIANAGLKVLALFLAFIVWFVVSAPRRESVSERTLPEPTQFATSFVRTPTRMSVAPVIAGIVDGY